MLTSALHFALNCFLMVAGVSGGGRGSFRKGENEPNFDSRFGGIEATEEHSSKTFHLKITQSK